MDVYVVMRWDLDSAEPITAKNVVHRVTAKAVFSNEAEADDEIERLNTLNRAKGCLYFCQVAMMYLPPAIPPSSD